MAEIKSALEIALERSKHLVFTEEEKREAEFNEVKKTIQGFLQKYIDQIITVDELRGGLEKLQSTKGTSGHELLLEKTVEQINLDLDNTPQLQLLTKLFLKDIGTLESVIDNYRKTVKTKASERMDVRRKEYADEKSISGSAVIPNLEADKVWMAEFMKTREFFDKELTELKTRYISA